MNSEALINVLGCAKGHKGDVVIFNGGYEYKGILYYNTTFLKECFNYVASEKDCTAILESTLAVGLLPKGYSQNFSLGASYCKLLRTDFLRYNNLQFNITVKFA